MRKREEFEKLTKDVERVSALSQPFRNHSINFTHRQKAF